MIVSITVQIIVVYASIKILKYVRKYVRSTLIYLRVFFKNDSMESMS